MAGNPSGSNVTIDGAVAVVHSRRLVAETLCIALRGIGVDAHLDPGIPTPFALVDTSQSATIERLSRDGTAILAFGSADPISIARAVRAGAAWHVADDIGFKQVAEHLTRLAAGETGPASFDTPPPDPAVALIDTLTRREQEILRSLVSGRRAADIADADFVSVTTVRNQIQSILTKLGAHSQLEAVAIAVRGGWTPLAA
jgi:DNA-binding NarL/FixJ family response regulator